jgi:hypothetical protein
VLNLLSRPPDQRPSRSHQKTRHEFAERRIRIFVADARTICIQPKEFFSALRFEDALAEKNYCGFEWVFASRLCRASSAHIVRCSGVKTLQTCLRVSIFICFTFFCF